MPLHSGKPFWKHSHRHMQRCFHSGANPKLTIKLKVHQQHSWPVENNSKVSRLYVTRHCQIVLPWGGVRITLDWQMFVFVIECADLGDLEEYFLWKKMWVGLRQGLMLCQRPLEVLSYWLSRTYRIVRSKISCKLLSVMRFPLPFPQTSGECSKNTSTMCEQLIHDHQTTEWVPMWAHIVCRQFVQFKGINFWNQLPPIQTVGKSPVDFHYVWVMSLNDVLSALWSSEASRLQFATARIIVEWDEKSHVSTTWPGVWGL